MKEVYYKQVGLVVRCLPFISINNVFALKGGTAINLFVRQNYPRMSIDIDLSFLAIKEREQSLIEIEQGLLTIAENIKNNVTKVKIKKVKNNSLNIISKLEVIRDGVAIKIEPNLILRGTVFPTQTLNLATRVADIYNMSAIDVNVVSDADLYAGKICAALDRQHPRDLFDIGYILKKDLDENLKNAFLIYLISNNRPMYELLAPNLIDIKELYRDEFIGMSNVEVSLEQLLDNRINLIQLIKKSLTDNDKRFLLSIKKGEPNFSLFPEAGVEDMPAIKWKLYNIKKMEPLKYKEQLRKLERVLA